MSVRRAFGAAQLQNAMALSKTYHGSEPQRVNKWLAQSGICSRREAEALIADGKVSINGAPVSDPGRKIAPGETVTIAAAAAGDGAKWTIVMNKPAGVVSAQPEPGQTPAARLLTAPRRFGRAGPAPPRDASLPPLGRLDLDSRGLLILSQDGVLAKAVIGPQSRLDKEYLVEVAGGLTERKLASLRHGLHLDGRPLKPARIDPLDRGPGGALLRFTLTEGRNRQIRRMCELVDLDVRDLFRVRIGPLHLGDLPEGEWRTIEPAERAAMIAAAG